MRTSKLLRLAVRRGAEIKFDPFKSIFGAGKRAERRAASGSIRFVGKIFVGLPAPSTPMGTPHIPLGFRFEDFANRELKISPTNVGWPLQSTAGGFVGLPLLSTHIAGVFVRKLEKSPPISAGVGTSESCGRACVMRRPS